VIAPAIGSRQSRARVCANRAPASGRLAARRGPLQSCRGRVGALEFVPSGRELGHIGGARSKGAAATRPASPPGGCSDSSSQVSGPSSEEPETGSFRQGAAVSRCAPAHRPSLSSEPPDGPPAADGRRAGTPTTRQLPVPSVIGAGCTRLSGRRRTANSVGPWRPPAHQGREVAVREQSPENTLIGKKSSPQAS
jgi:hypothetical protein